MNFFSGGSDECDEKELVLTRGNSETNEWKMTFPVNGEDTPGDKGLLFHNAIFEEFYRTTCVDGGCCTYGWRLHFEV